jgi:hypothetical protein
MEKQLENSRKRKKPFWPKLARAPAVPDTRTPIVGASLPRTLLSLSHSLPSGAELSAPVPLACAPLFPLFLMGPLYQAPSRFPRAPVLSLSAPWACAVSFALPAPAVDHRARTRARRRDPRPRRPPTRPCPFLSPARACTHSPASFHIVPLPLALCSCRQTSPETHASLHGHLARRRPRQASPSSAPR